MTSKKRDQNGNLCFKRRFFVPLIHDQRCMSWGQTLKDTRDEVYAEFPESNEWCTMQWADVFSWWFRCCLPICWWSPWKSFPPWNSESEKWEQSLWNLSKPTKRIHFLIISGWISCFIQFEKAVVQDFLGILQPLGKNGRHAAFGSWENDPPLRSAHHPGSQSGGHRWWANTSRMVGE